MYTKPIPSHDNDNGNSILNYFNQNPIRINIRDEMKVAGLTYA